ncbi:IS982 family transposase [Pseudolactococcus laudensis]
MTYNSTLTKVFVYLLTSIEAIYQTSVPLEIQNRKNVHLATSDCLVITCYLWGVLHFSETLYNATKGQYFHGCKCHALVSESGYVIDYTITPALMADSSMTEEVLSQFGTPTVLGDMGYLGQSLHDRLELKGIDLITPVRKNMKQKKILFPNFSKRRKVIERVFSFLTNLGAERCKSRSPQGFQLKLEMILLAYSLLLKSAKSLEPETLRYSIGYQVMAK